MNKRRFHLTFRTKILLSLVGTVFLFLAVLLFVVRNETSKQIRRMTEHARDRSYHAFNELERLYSNELLRFAMRISEKNRVPAALQEAVEEEEPQVLIDAAAYELNLAQIPLAIFTDEKGQPVVSLLGTQVLKNWRPGTLELQAQKLLHGEVQNVTGYQMVRNRLFTIHGILLSLFGRPIGTVFIGFPVDDALARRMGEVIEAEVAFVVNGRFLAATPMDHIKGLKEKMKTAIGSAEPIRVTLGNSHWILIPEPLAPALPDSGWRVFAVSLEEFLVPLYRIETVFQAAGILVLLISIGLGISISRSLAAPVKQLAAAAQQVAWGDYHSRVTVKGRDELSLLADSFNQMTHGLLLKEQYRGILDKVVSPEVAEEMVKGNITLGGENREVTTLFADVRGFTSITEGMEPQEVIAMLNEIMEHAGAAIEAEGGVVDKYVGDQVMAVFGAPISNPDDPLRAVRSALKIQESIRELNQQRKTRNQPEIKFGIGINTGLAVAGNMGSVKRLNYTVLGESVNIASRLCSMAGPSEILISENTYRQVAEEVDAYDYKNVSFKGLSKPIKAYKVKKIKFTNRLTGLFLAVFIPLIFALTGTPALHALTPPDPGLHYVSENGKFQVSVSGRLEISGYLPQESPSWLIQETEPFVSGGLTLFTDIFFGSRMYGLVQLQADRGEIPSNGPIKGRIEQAFLRYTFLSSYNLHLQVGKFVSPFGNYARRHLSAADPFIRPPLLHEYRTMICPGLVPRHNDGFIDWKYTPEIFRPIGAPVIWGVPYQAGIMLFGSFGKLTFQLAAMNSAPSSDPVQWDLDLDQGWNYSVVTHLDYRFSPELTLGLSFNYGPYSLEKIKETLPPDHSINDYKQVLWGLDITYTRGKAAVRMELIIDEWEVPNVLDYPHDISYYIELHYKFLPGLYGALRYNAIHFNKISLTSGEKEAWDYNVRRWQIAVGYRFTTRLEARAEYMWNHTAGPYDPPDNLLALQWIWRF